MTKTTTTLFLWLFLVAAAANLGFCYATTGKWANQTTHQTRCIPTEREALLEFKKHLKDSSNRLATWAAAADDGDCCSWYGVSCLGDSTTQYVTGLHLRSLSISEFDDSVIYGDWYDYIFGGKVSPALLSLTHLKYLDLSNNDFGGILIPSFLGSMRSLRSLNLSSAGFEGMIPHQLGNLSNLQYLNLESNSYYTADVENLQWMSGLSSLKFLDLSGWNLRKVLNWDKVILTTLPSLLQLHLYRCQLPSPKLHLLNNNSINASSISILDLSVNNFGQHPAILFSWIFHLKSLNSLNIKGNGFHGSIPRQLQNMSSLREVYLDWNSFNSSIPNWLYGSHTTLKVLSLHNNWLSSFQPQLSSSSVKNFSSLSVLDLSSNNFQGHIPDEIQYMTSLQKLDLSSNKFSSFVPHWLDGLTHLEHLNLSYNNLEGKISSANWNMPSLISLDMSPQSGIKLELEGGIPNSLKNCCNLRVLNLGGVKLRQDITQVLEILSLPGCTSNGLEELTLNDCQLFGNLATTNQHFGRFMFLKKLDFGFNNLSGTLPVTLGRLKRLEVLSLSGNSLAGDVSEAHFENLKVLRSFSASGNQLKLRVSRNWIPPFDQLHDLELGSWHIGPQFPAWLRSLENLYTLDLSNAGISSPIPVWFWNFSSNSMYLNLSHNQIHRVLPNILSQSQYTFTTIDMSSNLFHGPLPLVSFNFDTLDLSNNSFSGSITKFFQTVRFVRNLDFSNNNLSGKISDKMTNHYYLESLNLSHNALRGRIPMNIGFMKELESIDLSANQLSGEIPQSISSLTSLRNMNLSQNRLSGRIPVGNQMQTFDASSFTGNELCGTPLPNSCSKTNDDRYRMLFFYSSMAFGFVGGFWCFVGPLLLIRRWRFAYSLFLDRMWDRIWWKLHKFGMF